MTCCIYDDQLSIGGGDRDPKGEGSTSGGVFLRGSIPYLCIETQEHEISERLGRRAQLGSSAAPSFY